MSPLPVPALGARIREERLRRGLSLRALARDVGVSASLVSQIETGKSQPSVSTLYAITTALGIPVEDLFGTAEQPVDSTPALGQVPSVAAGLALLAADPVQRVGPVVRRDGRDRLELDSGVVWERLGRVPGSDADFLLVTYAPGGSSSGTGQLMRHSGVEYGYLVSGALTLTLGFDEHELHPGDAVCFESATPHRYRNEGRTPATGVWVVTE
ncbi:MAG: helix-turn-helix domain-containing protein [Mycobacteriales bacterium]